MICATLCAILCNRLEMVEPSGIEPLTSTLPVCSHLIKITNLFSILTQISNNALVLFISTYTHVYTFALLPQLGAERNPNSLISWRNSHVYR